MGKTMPEYHKSASEQAAAAIAAMPAANPSCVPLPAISELEHYADEHGRSGAGFSNTQWNGECSLIEPICR